jgi:hypothetical protein
LCSPIKRRCQQCTQHDDGNQISENFGDIFQERVILAKTLARSTIIPALALSSSVRR